MEMSRDLVCFPEPILEHGTLLEGWGAHTEEQLFIPVPSTETWALLWLCSSEDRTRSPFGQKTWNFGFSHGQGIQDVVGLQPVVIISLQWETLLSTPCLERSIFSPAGSPARTTLGLFLVPKCSFMPLFCSNTALRAAGAAAGGLLASGKSVIKNLHYGSCRWELMPHLEGCVWGKREKRQMAWLR